MRTSQGLVLAMLLAACTTGVSDDPPDQDPMTPSDPVDPSPPLEPPPTQPPQQEPPQQPPTTDPDPDPDPDEEEPLPTAPPPAPAFQIASPTIDIAPGAEITYCYYFRLSNPRGLAVKQWTSHMDGGRRMILFLTQGERKAAGTLMTDECGMEANGISPVWTYAAEATDAEMRLPADDGNGQPVGQLIKANQAGFLLMHFQNPTDQVIQARMELSAYAYDASVQVIPAAPFVTYNRRINLPAAPLPSLPVHGDCNVPAGVRFFQVSTHTHKQAIYTSIQDGNSLVFDTTSWGTPGRTWTAAPFFRFTTGNLSYQCKYENPNNYPITIGDNASRNEMCVTVGYYFPATDAAGSRGHYCMNSAVVN